MPIAADFNYIIEQGLKNIEHRATLEKTERSLKVGTDKVISPKLTSPSVF